MTIPNIIKEWRKGCSCAPNDAPAECAQCTAAAIAAIENEWDRLEAARVQRVVNINSYFGKMVVPTLKIFKLWVINAEDHDWCTNVGHTIVAESEAQARDMAQAADDWRQEKIWHDPARVSCKELDTSKPVIVLTSNVGS